MIDQYSKQYPQIILQRYLKLSNHNIFVNLIYIELQNIIRVDPREEVAHLNFIILKQYTEYLIVMVTTVVGIMLIKILIIKVWSPKHKNTERQFKYTKLITPNQTIRYIKDLTNGHNLIIHKLKQTIYLKLTIIEYLVKIFSIFKLTFTIFTKIFINYNISFTKLNHVTCNNSYLFIINI
jgi:hypothetical protein